MRRLIITAAALLAALGPVLADGQLVPPPQVYPVPPQPSQSCLMTALQLGYQTGRREVAYAATEACIAFTGARGVVLPYGYYGPYVPSGWTPPGWALPGPGYGEAHRPIRNDPARIRHGSVGAANNRPRCQRSDHRYGIVS